MCYDSQCCWDVAAFTPTINERSRSIQRSGSVYDALYSQGLAQIEAKRRAEVGTGCAFPLVLTVAVVMLGTDGVA